MVVRECGRTRSFRGSELDMPFIEHVGRGKILQRDNSSPCLRNPPDRCLPPFSITLSSYPGPHLIAARIAV
jgi:hypothetical protein